MGRPAKCSSQQGFLLVEAVLSAVVIAVGLTFVSRGLSNQLRALHTVGEYDTLLSLARGKLLELEGARLFRAPSSEAQRDGVFGEPHQAYRWTVTATLRKEENGEAPTSSVVLTVQRNQGPSSLVRLSALWPTDEVPQAWF